MGVGAAIGGGTQLGSQWANNPNLNAPTGFQNFMSHMDPLGNFITKMGGDPLNIYGNKNNPNALLFPTANPNANGPTTLPNLGAASMIPKMPGGSFGVSTFGAGPYNAMANQSAGQIFMPGVQQPTANSVTQNVPNQNVPNRGAKPGLTTMSGGYNKHLGLNTQGK